MVMDKYLCDYTLSILFKVHRHRQNNCLFNCGLRATNSLYSKLDITTHINVCCKFTHVQESHDSKSGKKEGEKSVLP